MAKGCGVIQNRKGTQNKTQKRLKTGASKNKQQIIETTRKCKN